MISFPAFFSNPPSLRALPLKRYRVQFSLERLAFGVDSIHIDVRISDQLHSVVRRAVAASLIRYSRSEGFFGEEKRERRENELFTLRNVCTDVLQEGINRAKLTSEVQIDFLGQISLAKMFLEEIQSEYRKLITKFEVLIRTFELSRQYDEYEWLKMKEKLAEIKRNQKRIVRLVGEELFRVLADVHLKSLKNIREANFPAEEILPDNFFINPTLHADNVADDYLLMDSYVLLGQRSAEPDNYGSVKSIIEGLLDRTDLLQEETDGDHGNPEAGETEGPPPEGSAFDPWLMEIDNVSLLFDCFDSEAQYEKAKQSGEPEKVLAELKSRMKIQQKMLNLFYGKFRQSGLLELIAAAYEMKIVCRSYCPPLRPVQLREYLVRPRSRKALLRILKRRESLEGAAFSLEPLQAAIRRIRSGSVRDRKEHLLRFLRDFLRYHRDLANGRLLKQAMETINLVKDEKILLLSKKNRLLYEFPLPEERSKEEKPVISHVIVKADIRGSMDVTETMRARGLNPASYFSLNFFDPISEILSDYNATKEFIEGDAIILSIFENEDTAQGWYSVARACGLAMTILQIVRQYNLKNEKHDLPILELGIGICYKENPPAFLFDGDSRIMISQAINLADRLSSCDKRLRRRLKHDGRLFNLSVFQNARKEDVEATADDLSLRYNVNGIELDTEGFAKLSREINLTRIEYPAEKDEKVALYTGKVPTLGGRYQRLAIREASVLEVKPDTLEAIGPTPRKYYEVCTHPAIFEFIDNQK